MLRMRKAGWSMRVDWYWLVVTSVWVFGCGVMLAVVSIVYASAANKKAKFFSALTQPLPMLGLMVGAVYALIGVCFTGVPLVQKVFWGVGVLWLCVETLGVWRKKWRAQQPPRR